MSERYYRYNSDDAIIDIENDEIYDWVLEREQMKELDNVGPRCIRDFGGEFREEHFGNLNQGGGGLVQNLVIILVVLMVLYLLYCWCQVDNQGLKRVPYKASFSY